MSGLSLLIDIAETFDTENIHDIREKEKIADDNEIANLEKHIPFSEDAPRPAAPDGAAKAITKTHIALATTMLQILGPYNSIKCHNCGSHEVGGSNCKQCGHRIKFSSNVMGENNEEDATENKPSLATYSVVESAAMAAI